MIVPPALPLLAAATMNIAIAIAATVRARRRRIHEHDVSSSSLSSSSTTTTTLLDFLIALLLHCALLPSPMSSSSGDSDSDNPASVTTSNTVTSTVYYMYSIAPWWGPITRIVVSQWYKLLLLLLVEKNDRNDDDRSTQNNHNDNNHDNDNTTATTTLTSRMGQALVSDGPLGKGGQKVVQVLVAVVLWKLLKKEWPAIRLGPLPTTRHDALPWIALLAVISLTVNLVLYLWSSACKYASTNSANSSNNNNNKSNTNSRGRRHHHLQQHTGVNEMVKSSLNRELSWSETAKYAILALTNAACEEITSRWFWYQEFAHFYQHHDNDKYKYINIPNLAQSLIFGIWHYYGIPSGWSGVALTFVYGFVMGMLMEHVNEGGLFLPIVAHAIADFYIFTCISRGKASGGGGGGGSGSGEKIKES